MAELNSNAGTEDDWLPTRASLIERLQRQADASAWNRGWREFYASYYPVIVRFACRRGLPMAEADDLAQEVLLGIARKIEGFKYDPEVCQFKTWLFRIASNQITDRLRRLKRREKLGERHNQPLDALEGVADPGAVGPDDACGRVFDLELLNAALELVAHRVKPMNMRLFVYNVIQGHNVEETVEHFRSDGVKAATVHVARHRIQALLDAELAILARGDRRP